MASVCSEVYFFVLLGQHIKEYSVFFLTFYRMWHQCIIRVLEKKLQLRFKMVVWKIILIFWWTFSTNTTTGQKFPLPGGKNHNCLPIALPRVIACVFLEDQQYITDLTLVLCTFILGSYRFWYLYIRPSVFSASKWRKF